MSRRKVTLLHVEDDVAGQRLLAHHLRVMPEYEFDIHYAEAEAEAIESFHGGNVDLVILDYQLKKGNGLNCVRELRRRDSVVPIIAVSGIATLEIASELLEAGADDYIEKQNLTSAVLARSMRDTLVRAQACRRRVEGQKP